MSNCAICDTTDTLNWPFGLDRSFFNLCKGCSQKYLKPIELGVTSVFPYIAALNSEKTSDEIVESGEFQCKVCKNIEDFTNLNLLYFKDDYEVCDFCREKLESVIEGILQVLRSARNEELKSGHE